MKVVFLAVFVTVLTIASGKNESPSKNLSTVQGNPEAGVSKIGKLIGFLFPSFKGDFLQNFISLAKSIKKLFVATSPSGSRTIDPSHLYSMVDLIKKKLMKLIPYVYTIAGMKPDKALKF
uniref:RNA-directed RNA polymerase L n=1 Tax=Lygus hesperus TaxID=30085 RepID=A0A0A9XB70_LYGHE